MTKLNKPSKFFMVNLELTIHDLLVEIMERYKYDLPSAKDLMDAVVEAQAEEIQEEAETNENNA